MHAPPDVADTVMQWMLRTAGAVWLRRTSRPVRGNTRVDPLSPSGRNRQRFVPEGLVSYWIGLEPPVCH